MPRRSSSTPRKKLPPPTTTATWMPCCTTCAIWRANSWTTSGSTPIAPPPNTSPDSLRTTRRARGPPEPPGRASGAVRYSSATVWAIAPPECVATNLSRSGPSRGTGPGSGYASGEARTGTARPPPRCDASGLAHLEPDEPAHGDPDLLEDLLHGLLLVLHRGLLEQDEVLEERADAALDDLRQRGLRLALLAGGLLGDAALGGDHVGGYLVAVQVLRAHRGDLHRHPARVGVARLVALAGVLDQHAHRGRQVGRLAVQVDRDRRGPVEDGEPVHHDLLADLGGELLDGRRDGTPGGQLRGEQRVDVGRLRGGRVLDQRLG